MLLTLDEIKQQCRIEADFTDEDDLLTRMGSAAQSCTEKRLGRTLYADAVPDDDPGGLLLSDDIRQAMLMLTAYWYENRAAVCDIELSEAPLAYGWLVEPYGYASS